MAKAYFQAYHSMLEAMEPLDDAERGRLFTALLVYSATGQIMDMPGSERYVFCALRVQIDREKDIHKKRSIAGKQGADVRWQTDISSEESIANDGKEWQKIANDGKEWQDIANDSKNEDCYNGDSKAWQSMANDSKNEDCHPALMEDIDTGIEPIDNNIINNINNYITNTDVLSPSTPEETLSLSQGNTPPPSPPKGARGKKKDRVLPAFFDAFWQEYPRKVAKEDAIQAWRKLAPDEGLVNIIIADVRRKKSDRQWLRDSGQFIPYPATYINGRRWTDEGTQLGPPGTPAGMENLARLYQKFKAEEDGQHDAKRGY